MSGYQTLNFRLTGASPLLMHNGQLVDPLNPHSKRIAQITGKRKKTEADHEEMSKREWFGSLYVGSDGAPCIPPEMIEAAAVRGAMKEKRGPQAKAGLLVEANSPLLYDGPRDPAKLWEDERFRLRTPAKVGQAKIMRTRPHFANWAAEVEVKFLPDMLDRTDVLNFLSTAGAQIGIGDWRPRFGRFEATVLEQQVAQPPQRKRRST